MSHYLGRIYVGWSSIVREDVEDMIPEIPDDKRIKDEDLQAKKKQEKREKFLAEAAKLPVFAKLASVHLADIAHNNTQTFPIVNDPRSLASQIKDWLLANKEYYRAIEMGRCPFEFIGFEPREFVKILGMELAEFGDPLPDAAWIAASNYKDIQNIVLGDLNRHNIKIDTVLERFGLVKAHEIPLPYTPLANPEMDLKVTIELASRMGMLECLPQEV